MTELFHDFWFLLFAWLTVTSVAATIGHAWQKVRRADREASLKEAMLRRDLSVEEMERLLGAAFREPEELAAAATEDDVEELTEALGKLGK